MYFCAHSFFDMFMRKKLIKNHYTRLSRYPDALIPAALLSASILGQRKHVLLLYACAFAIHLFSLGVSHGIRAAFAGQTRVKSVRGSIMCALLLQITGFIILLFLSYFGYNSCFSVLFPFLIAGVSLNIEHMFYEYLCAMGDSYSAAMCHGLTALFTITGLLLDAGREISLFIPITATISAIISVVVSAVIHGLSGKLNARVIRCAPRAMIYSAFYPSVFAITVLFLRVDPLSVPFFTGLTIYEFCRTPYRRSSMESRMMNRFLFVLSVFTGICMILSFCLYGNTASQTVFFSCFTVIIASVCSFVMFGRV